MSLKVGDSVFIRAGNPAVVRQRDELTGNLRLDTELKQVQQDMRHGYINGIPDESRKKLYEILDEVKASSKDPRERAESLLTKVRELEEDPTQLQLTRYLRAEMFHIMNTNNIRPREYSVHETKTR